MLHMEQSPQQNSSNTSVLKRLAGIRQGAPVLFYAVVFWLAAECIMIFIAPLIIPQYVYLRLYLGKRARESTSRFLAGRDEFLVYDPVVGWRNRPNSERGKWIIDSAGSRSTHPIGPAPTKPNRVLFLGSSLTNGGMVVSAHETISAYAEDSTTEAVNFATMMYSLDQMCLAYESDLYRFNANVVVVGLSGDPADGLTNRYIPLRYVSEVNVPYFKPRFELADTGAVLMPVPPLAAYDRILKANDLADTLRATDAFYSELAEFMRFGLTPLSDGMWYLFKKARNLTRLVAGDDTELPLAITIMRRLKLEAGQHHASVVFMLLPDQTITFPSVWRSRLPDSYSRVVAELKVNGFTLLDGRAVLRQSGRAAWQVYMPDAVHFSPEGNRLIGQALQQLLKSMPTEISERPNPNN